jgi:hypothetical protein
MRFINTNGYSPKDWQKEQQLKLLALRGCINKDARTTFFKVANNKTWNRHKEYFEKLSHGKCWFTEANASVSDYAIEHYRPKNKVNLIAAKDNYTEKRNSSDVNGYWWLAYELENLRLAAYKPNQLKGNYFPLRIDSIIATANNNSWRKEIPMLLDPCVATDVALLTYDGVEPVPSNPDETEIQHIRARISIKVYGLKHGKLKKARSRIFEEAKNYFRNCERNWVAIQKYDSLKAEAYQLALENFRDNCSNLVEMLRPDKQFTRMILAFLTSMNKQWIKDYILNIASNRKYI